MRLETILSLIFIASANAANCGLQHVAMRKFQFKGKEYAFVDADVDFYGGKTWCESFLATEDFGFPFGTLVKPTTEEVIFLKQQLPDETFNTGYHKISSSFEYTPEDYGIYEGHGVNPRKHWAEGEPSNDLGSVYVTNQFKTDPKTGVDLPLYATSLLGDIRPFVCVRKITVDFPANMGTFNTSYECENMLESYPIGNTEYALMKEPTSFDKALEICSDLDSEGFENSQLAAMDQNDFLYVQRYLLPYGEMWTAFRYSEELDEYVNVHDGVTPVYGADWDIRQPSRGDCVVGHFPDQYFYGVMETTQCDEEHIFVCSRPIEKSRKLARGIFGNKEFYTLNDELEYEDAQVECGNLLEGGRLAQPTSEELFFIINEVLPFFTFPFLLGYEVSYEVYPGSFGPSDYGIKEGQHGSSLSHYVPGEPDCIGVIAVSSQYGKNATGDDYALLTCASYYSYLHFVCERDLTLIRGDTSSPRQESNNDQEGFMFITALTVFILGGVVVLIVAVFRYKSASEEVKVVPEEQTL